MKILLINSLSDPERGGGAEIMIWTLAKQLLRLGHEPVIVATSSVRQSSIEIVSGIRVWGLGFSNVYWPYDRGSHGVVAKIRWHMRDIYSSEMKSRLREVIEVEKPAVASCHNLPGLTSSVWFALEEARVPFVQVLHDFYLLCVRSTMYKRQNVCRGRCRSCQITRWLIQKKSHDLTHVVSVSRFLLDKHKKYGYFSTNAKKEVIWDARDPTELFNQTSIICDAGRNSSAHDDGPVVLGFIGSIAPNKGLEALAKALQKCLTKGLEFRLCIAGNDGGEYARFLKEIFPKEQTVWLGRVRQAEFFQLVELVVVPSAWEEPLGMAVLEAFAFGRPVIASSRGGLAETVSDGIDGWLFEPNSADALVGLLELVLTDRSKLAQFGVAAREKGHDVVDIDRWARRYEQIYLDAAYVGS